MKKFFSMLLLVSLLLVMLTACGGSKPAEAPKAEAPKAEAPKTEAPKTEAPKTEAPKTDKKVKVALLVTSLGDMSFNDSANDGMTRAKKDLGAEVQVIETGDQVDKLEASLLDSADRGYDLILAGSRFKEYITTHAASYPKTTFVLFDASVDYAKADLKNVYSIVYKANEASFLGGFISAKLSGGTIGFLGGTDQPVINDFLLGYIQGAKLANPNVKVAISYVGNFKDASKGKELSNAMYGQGAKMIFNVAGGAGIGLIEAAVEKKALVLGVDSDQAMKYKSQNKEEFAKVIPTSALKNVGDSLYRAVDLYIKGQLKVGAVETLGIKEGGVGIADNEFYKAMVPQEVRDEVKKMQDDILSGKIVVDTAYGKTTDEISKVRDSVKP